MQVRFLLPQHSIIWPNASFVLKLRDGAEVARRAHNPKVVGSNPTLRNYFKSFF